VPNFCSDFFNNFNFILYVFFAIGSFAPGSKTPPPKQNRIVKSSQLQNKHRRNREYIAFR